MEQQEISCEWMVNGQCKKKMWWIKKRKMFCINDGNRRWRCARFQTHLIIHLSLIYFIRCFGCSIQFVWIYVYFFIYFDFVCRLPPLRCVPHTYFLHVLLSQFHRPFSPSFCLCFRAFWPEQFSTSFQRWYANTAHHFLSLCLFVSLL